MLVLIVEIGGVLAVAMTADGVVRRVSLPAAAASTHAGAGLLEGILAALESFEIRRERVALVVPEPIDRGEAERLSVGLRRGGYELEGVMCELGPGTIPEDPADRDALLASGSTLRRVAREGGPSATVDPRPAFEMIYASVRTEVQRRNTRDLVRMGITADQVVAVAFASLIDDTAEGFQLGPSNADLSIPRAILEEALRRSARTASGILSDAGVEPTQAFFGDELLARWIASGGHENEEWAACPVRRVAGVAKAVEAFLRSVPSDEARPIHRVGALRVDADDSPIVADAVEPGRSTRWPRSAVVASLLATTWAFGATIWGITQRQEIDRLRAGFDAFARQQRDGDPIAPESDGEPAVAETELVGALSPPAQPASGNAAVAPPRHLDTRRTAIGLDVVYLSPSGGEGFWIATTEVPADLYRRFAQSKRRASAGTGPTPALGVSAEGAQAFCDWATERDEVFGYRLPTADEWSIACLAGSDDRFGGGLSQDSFDLVISNNYVNGSGPVQSAGVNAWGIAGMHGNASEWVVAEGDTRLAGGSWRDDAKQCDCGSIVPPTSERQRFAGVRVVLEMKR